MKGFFTAAAAAGGILGLTKAIDSRLEVTSYDITSCKIPKEFDGYKIVHLSDAHSQIVPGLINAVEGEHPDLIVCTGDMTDDDLQSIKPTEYIIKKAVRLAPVYMVTGNHELLRSDMSSIEKSLSAMGAKFLHDERIILEKGAARIALSGIDDPGALSVKGIMKKINDSLERLGQFDGYEVLLFHRANFFEQLAGFGFDLILSGHMHGGQVRLPRVGGVLSPKTSVLSDKSMLRPKYFAGAYSYSDMTMLVSRGLGNPMLLPRIFNRPELVAVTVHSREDENI